MKESNIQEFKSFISRQGYLLALVAWFVTLAVIVDTYFSANTELSDAQKSLNTIVQNQEKSFQQICSDSSFNTALVNGDFVEADLLSLKKLPYFFYVYKIDEYDEYTLKFWNTNSTLPSSALIYLSGNSGFVKLSNGFYVWNKHETDSLMMIALMPVKYNYIITNDYLKNDFAFKSDKLEGYDLTFENKGLPIESIYGNELFSIESKYNIGVKENHVLSVVFIVVAIFIGIFFLQLLANFLARITKPIFGIVFFIGIILLFRIISYKIDFPINTRQFELFDPAIYGSSYVLKSLGDLLVNVILGLWGALFTRAIIVQYNLKITTKRFWQRWVVIIAGLVLILAAVYTGTYIIKTLVADSQISFDVMNFFSLNVYSVVGFIILCSIANTFYLLCITVMNLMQPILPTNMLIMYVLVLVLGLIYLSFHIGRLDGGVHIYVLIWLTLFLFLINNKYFIITSGGTASARLIFWQILFSASITSLIILQNKNKEIESRKYYAEALAAKADPTSETLINTMLTDFREDYLADNFHKLLSPYQNKAFKDSLLEGNMSGYIDRYETRILSYDMHEEPLHNEDSISFNDLNTIFETQAKPTGIANLYYYDLSYDKYSYISKKVLRQVDGQLLGYVFILANLKVDNVDAVYPELFNRGQENSLENSTRYSFAIYSNGKLISSYNDYPFATTINMGAFSRGDYFEIEKKGFHELWYNAGAGRMVVIVNENKLIIQSITLFSYFFCAFLIITFLIWLINALITSRFKLKVFRSYWRMNLRNQIHGTIIFISVLSFLVIGAASILFFVNRYQNNNREMLSRVIHIMENEVKSFTRGDTSVNPVSSIQNLSSEQLDNAIRRISEVHGTDVNLYNLDGSLAVSSLPLPYNKGILSTMMEPVAFFHMHKNNEVQFFQQERIGKLTFISNYKPVINKDGDKFAYLNIPYFTSESNLKEEISNFLVTIINLNAFIFLIAGIVAFFITSRITGTFSVISEKMKMINLEKENVPISWSRDDEIGQLVQEFNTMLGKLDASAEALAKTEREGAWREMARQIAHEIKNPLTPMKLSMQYLQKAMSQKSEDVQELTNNVAKTMVEQIDHLSYIASEFNQFANIEHSNKVILNLNDVLRSIIALFNADPNVELNYTLYKDEVLIEADKSHINRVFTNLIQNAIQSVPEERKPVIRITQVMHDKEMIVSIRDNGSGIPDEIRQKIFMPNFTTKTSGTGLGLAMCKRMVEHAGGKIWFETEINSGSIFYVSFPLAV